MKFKSDRQRKAVMSKLNERARMMVGDGRLPNKYFVGVSNDYEIYDKKNNMTDFAFNKNKCLKPKFEIISEVDDYDEATNIAENKLGTMYGEGLKAFPVTNVTVEDRLSGETYRHSVGNPSMGDNKFSVEQEKKLIAKNPELKKKERPFDVTGFIVDYEGGNLNKKDTLRLFSHLVKTGQAWQLQGSIYGRPARDLIKSGYIDKSGKILKELD